MGKERDAREQPVCKARGTMDSGQRVYGQENFKGACREDIFYNTLFACNFNASFWDALPGAIFQGTIRTTFWNGLPPRHFIIAFDIEICRQVSNCILQPDFQTVCSDALLRLGFP